MRVDGTCIAQENRKIWFDSLLESGTYYGAKNTRKLHDKNLKMNLIKKFHKKINRECLPKYGEKESLCSVFDFSVATTKIS